MDFLPFVSLALSGPAVEVGTAGKSSPDTVVFVGEAGMADRPLRTVEEGREDKMVVVETGRPLEGQLQELKRPGEVARMWAEVVVEGLVCWEVVWVHLVVRLVNFAVLLKDLTEISVDWEVKEG